MICGGQEKLTTINVLPQYPSIKKMFCRYNTAILSSAPVERSFSYAAIVLNKKRSSMSDTTIEQQLLIKSNRQSAHKRRKESVVGDTVESSSRPFFSHFRSFPPFPLSFIPFPPSPVDPSVPLPSLPSPPLPFPLLSFPFPFFFPSPPSP